MLSFREIRELQKSRSARAERKLFTAEGLRIFREVPPEMIAGVFATEEFCGAHREVIEGAVRNGAELSVVSPSRMESISDTKTPQGVLAVLRMREWSAEEILDAPDPLILILENLQDPGNLGTILRTAEAAGACGVFVTQDCADRFQPKTVRGTMGALFRVPCADVGSTEQAAERLLPELRKRGVASYAACMEGKKTLWEENLSGGCAFLIGNEGNGLSRTLLEAADRTVRIPMSGRTESLNAAMAAGILLYEAARQRSAKH